MFLGLTVTAQGFEADIIETSAGNLKITFLGHGTLMFTYGGKVIHVDPLARVADYTKLPKAHLVLITHEHFDHFTPKTLNALRTDKTVLVMTQTCARQVKGATVVMKNGDVKTVEGLTIEAVPAYNIVHRRSDGRPFHPRGIGNGYVITFGNKRVYVAGDTENIPAMKGLRGIDVAFLPMNLPYTMTPEMVADAAKAFRPKILYPYHYGDTDTRRIVDLLQNIKEIQVRIRNMN